MTQTKVLPANSWIRAYFSVQCCQYREKVWKVRKMANVGNKQTRAKCK